MPKLYKESQAMDNNYEDEIKTEKVKPIKLTKREIVAKVAEVTEINHRDAEVAINTLVSIIIAELQVGHEITLPGLGTFAKKRQKDRIGINPLTQQRITIPGKNVPKFKPAKNLKDAVGLTE